MFICGTSGPRSDMLSSWVDVHCVRYVKRLEDEVRVRELAARVQNDILKERMFIL